MKPGSGLSGSGRLVTAEVSHYCAIIIKIAGGNNIAILFNRSHMGTIEEIPRLALPSFQRAVLHLRQHTIGATSCQAHWRTCRNFGHIIQSSLKSYFCCCFWATFFEVSSVYVSNVYPGYIPNPNFFHPGTRIRIKEFKCFN